MNLDGVAKDEYHLYNFKITEPYVKGAEQFTFSFEDYKGRIYTYQVKKTKSPVSNPNMWAFWKQIDKYNKKSRVPNIWMDKNLKRMDEQGFIKIKNTEESPQLELPLYDPQKTVSAQLDYIIDDTHNRELSRFLSSVISKI
jgi:hypothetical protein